MKAISVTICKTKHPLKLLPPLKITGREAALTGRQLIQWLKSQGAKPLDQATRKRLKAGGNLGMPAE